MVELTVPYEVPHYANLRQPRGYAFLGDGMIVSVCQPEVSYTIVLRRPGEGAATGACAPDGRAQGSCARK